MFLLRLLVGILSNTWRFSFFHFLLCKQLMEAWWATFAVHLSEMAIIRPLCTTDDIRRSQYIMSTKMFFNAFLFGLIQMSIDYRMVMTVKSRMNCLNSEYYIETKSTAVLLLKSQRAEVCAS